MAFPKLLLAPIWLTPLLFSSCQPDQFEKAEEKVTVSTSDIAPPKVGDPLLAFEHLEAANTITISDPEKNQLTLAKNEDGIWTLPDQGFYPVATGEMNQLLIPLLQGTLRRPVTQDPEKAATHPKDAGSIILETTDDQLVRSIEFGPRGQTDGLSVGDISVCLDRQPSIWLTDQSPFFNLQPDDWRESEIVKDREEDALRWTFKQTGGPSWTFSREHLDAPWIASPPPPSGKAVDMLALEQALGTILGFIVPAPDAADASKPNQQQQLTHQVTFTNNRSWTFHLAPPAGTNPNDEGWSQEAVHLRFETTSPTWKKLSDKLSFTLSSHAQEPFVVDLDSIIVPEKQALRSNEQRAEFRADYQRTPSEQ